jgi:hypothetical protein
MPRTKIAATDEFKRGMSAGATVSADAKLTL